MKLKLGSFLNIAVSAATQIAKNVTKQYQNLANNAVITVASDESLTTGDDRRKRAKELFERSVRLAGLPPLGKDLNFVVDTYIQVAYAQMQLQNLIDATGAAIDTDPTEN